MRYWLLYKLDKSSYQNGKQSEKFPKGWIITPLNEIAKINPRTLDKPLQNLEKLQVSFIPMKNVEEESGKIDLSIKRKYDEVKKGYTPFTDGDILFAKITPCMENGKIAIANNLENGIGFGSTEFHVIRLLSNKLSKKYFFFFLVQDSFRKNAQRYMKGTAGQLRVPSQYLEQVLIPLPPLNEQKRIVTKLEELFTKLDAGIEYLKKNQILLKQYRQSILKNAFEGKLTEKWREENKDEIDGSLSFYKKIKADKLILSDEHTIEYNSKELPYGWIKLKIKDVCERIIGGGTPSRQNSKYFCGNIVWLTPTEIPKDKILLLNQSREKITKEGLERSSATIIPKHSVLLTSRATIGSVAITGCVVTTNQGFASFVCAKHI
jgi:type I restriction enzyme S subunit